jgi:hypothetical protein
MPGGSELFEAFATELADGRDRLAEVLSWVESGWVASQVATNLRSASR